MSSITDSLKKLRYDGLWWRKFAALGATYGPEWWKRYSPAAIGMFCFIFIGANRRNAIANLKRVCAESSRSPTSVALRMFVEFAYCLSETLERFGPRPMPVRVDLPNPDPIEQALESGRGAIVVTGHFGNWDIAAADLLRYGRPTHVVMAHEQNRSTNPYVERMRADRGLNIVYSDQSVLASLELLHALRRNEVVALQIDRLASLETAREVDLFGAAVRLPRGPFELARLSGAPLIAIFAPRRATRHYEIHFGEARTLTRTANAAEIEDCVNGVAREMEDMIRLHPHQWFQFEPFWVDDAAPASSAPTRRPRAKTAWVCGVRTGLCPQGVRDALARDFEQALAIVVVEVGGRDRLENLDVDLSRQDRQVSALRHHVAGASADDRHDRKYRARSPLRMLLCGTGADCRRGCAYPRGR